MFCIQSGDSRFRILRTPFLEKCYLTNSLDRVLQTFSYVHVCERLLFVGNSVCDKTWRIICNLEGLQQVPSMSPSVQPEEVQVSESYIA